MAERVESGSAKTETERNRHTHMQWMAQRNILQNPKQPREANEKGRRIEKECCRIEAKEGHVHSKGSEGLVFLWLLVAARSAYCVQGLQDVKQLRL